MVVSAGTSTPPTLTATPVSAIPATLGVNGYSAVPSQSSVQPSSEAIYTNGLHPYPGNTGMYYIAAYNESEHGAPGQKLFTSNVPLLPAQSPVTQLDPLQQAYAGMQHYTGG